MDRLRASFRVVFFLFFALVTVGVGTTARADEIAPELEGADLRVRARTELNRLAASLSDADRSRLTGVYVAFDATQSDGTAQVACDDDGDYVVLLSDAMLRLLAQIARADTFDERNGSRKVEEYAAFIARTQVPGKRLVPPAPGFFAVDKPGDAGDERLLDVLAFVIGDELDRLRNGDLVCPHPTATRESGDDVWTPDEARHAVEIAAKIYPAPRSDEPAVGQRGGAGRSKRGALAVARFFARLEAENAGAGRRFVSSYVRLHPGAAIRLARLEAKVAQTL